jgi:hypothetical protein
MGDSENEVKWRLSVAPNINKQILYDLQWDLQNEDCHFFVFAL